MLVCLDLFSNDSFENYGRTRHKRMSKHVSGMTTRIVVVRKTRRHDCITYTVGHMCIIRFRLIREQKYDIHLADSIVKPTACIIRNILFDT